VKGAPWLVGWLVGSLFGGCLYIWLPSLGRLLKKDERHPILPSHLVKDGQGRYFHRVQQREYSSVAAQMGRGGQGRL